jgi:cell division protein FtsB
MIIAVVVAYYSFFGEEGYRRLLTLRHTLQVQREDNNALEDEVRSLKKEVHGLQTSERAIERAARDELGMARPNEVIFFFEDKSK